MGLNRTIPFTCRLSLSSATLETARPTPPFPPPLQSTQLEDGEDEDIYDNLLHLMNDRASFECVNF